MNAPIRPVPVGQFANPYDFIKAAYDGMITPFASGPSDIPGVSLHISLLLRDGLPMVGAQTPLLVDVMTEEADDLHKRRNTVLAADRADSDQAAHPSKIQMAGAFALNASYLDPVMRLPITSVLWWQEEVSWASYRAVVAEVPILAAVMFQVTTASGDPSTLVVEAQRNADECLRSLGRRQRRGWYPWKAGIPAPSIVAGTSTISALLPPEGVLDSQFM